MERDANLYERTLDNIETHDSSLLEQMRSAVRECNTTTALRILDLGCNTGAHIDALSRFGNVTGVDSSPALIKQAQEKHPAANFIVADMCALPFDDSFDVVFSDNVFHWLPDHVALLKSVATALSDGGILIAEMGAEGNIAHVEAGYTWALKQHSGDYSCQFCFPREASYHRLLKIAGFEVEFSEVFDQPTRLAQGRVGLRLLAERLFTRSLGLYQEDDRKAILDDLERACESNLWDAHAGCWTIDFRRLRFTARKVRNTSRAGGASQLNILGT
ncbi:MAG: class I SAM-dependent methyltransferase [Gordonibacter sp.]|nr:class I SAM-dependent methyltransferase [Gordonibacter sp.]